MNIFGIILWVYLLGGEAVLLAIAFNICRKELKKSPHQGKNNRRRA